MVDIELFKQKVKDILSKEIESTQFNLKNMKNKLLVIYQTQKGREIYRDWDTNYVPSKNDLISFKYVDSNLNENDKKKLHYVIDIKFQLPNTIVVTVFPQISIADVNFGL